MPIYEYACKCCHGRFEVKQSVMDEPIRICPTCQGEVRRVIHPVGIVFKGSGFYTTDNAKGRSAVAPGTEDSSSQPAASKADDKADDKKEEKKEEKKEPAAVAAGETKSGS